jgi:putative toxin-antitoxin system antitoxin component (TIGR02293 family)
LACLRQALETSSQTKQGIIDEVIGYATEVIGNREKAMLWLGAPVRGLDFATPISLLATKEGVERVNEILGQMEHGIW